jgi:hypothetical protein
MLPTRVELRLVIDLPTADDVAREWRAHLSCGGAFVAGARVDANESCVLVLVGPRGSLELAARTVWTGDGGVGVQLDGWDGALKERLERWVEDAQQAPRPSIPVLPTVRFGASTPAPVEELAPLDLGDPTIDEAETEAEDEAETEAETEAEAEDEELARDPVARNVFERLRNLSVVEQLKIARAGEVHERMALERLYGKTVWDALLRNPRITHPEIARIARMGSLPRPLLELIVGNTAWLRSPEVRRALLANLRLTPDMITRVLRFLPKHELRLVPQQTAYPNPVRDAARRILKADL